MSLGLAGIGGRSIMGDPLVNPITVTPDTLALTLTFFVPLVGQPIVCTPDPAVLTITTFAPHVFCNTTVTPGTRALTITRFAPVVTTGTSRAPRIQRDPRADQRSRNGIDLVATILNSLMDQDILFIKSGELARGKWRLRFVVDDDSNWDGAPPADLEDALNRIAAALAAINQRP